MNDRNVRVTETRPRESVIKRSGGMRETADYLNEMDLAEQGGAGESPRPHMTAAASAPWHGIE